jgi:hypothetical protein
MKYEELISRNKGFISKKLQERIGKCRILLIGCGLGGQIGLLAARTGFRNFILIDGDAVEVNNLNRQAFRLEHVGQNKAQALTSIIKEINPRAKIEAYQKFLKDEKLAEELIDKSDVVVNMADPEEIMYFINSYAQSKGKIVFFPMNPAWGGYLLIFTSDSPKLEEIVGGKLKGNIFYLALFEKTVSKFPLTLSKLLKKLGKKLLTDTSLAGPQLGVANYLTSSLVVTGIIKWLSGEPIKKAPEPIFMDLWENL